MRPVKFVLDQVLLRHEPYPAWVVGRGMQFLACNCAAEALLPGMCSLQPEQIVDLGLAQVRYERSSRSGIASICGDRGWLDKQAGREANAATAGNARRVGWFGHLTASCIRGSSLQR